MPLHPPPTLSRRELNRALLARQHLLERSTMPALAMVEHLLGLQAQAPAPPYIGLWTRVAGFRTEHLAALLGDGAALRLALMRGTVHLVSAADCGFLRPLVAPVLERPLRAGSPYARDLAGLDLEEVAAAAARLLATPQTMTGIGAALAERWPDRRPEALAMVARGMLPLVQLPPRAVWGAPGWGGRPVLQPAERWLGRPLGPGGTAGRLVRRYLGAFGPASVADVQAWSGLTGLRPVVEGLRGELLSFRDEAGRELFDLPEAPRPDLATPAPVRLLPAYDNLLLSHADRTRVLSDPHRKAMVTSNGIVKGGYLIDGFVAGQWDLVRRAGELRIVVEPLVPLSVRRRSEVAAESRRLLRFAAGSGDRVGVEFRE